MMEEDEEQRFLCRFCNKSFSSGKSLGGHMRGHLALICAEKSDETNNGDLGSEREDFKKEMKVPLSSELDPEDVGEASYGLRENPKKSWRISDSKHGDLKKLNLCKECGKGFPSLRALSGHMRSHSVKGREEISSCKECGKEFDSMRALFGHMRSHSKRLRVSGESADYEISCPIRKKRSRTRYNKSTSNPFSLNVDSSITVIEADEVKEAALCLMILSRGVRSWDKFDLIRNFSSNNNSSVNLESQNQGNAGNDVRSMKKQRENLDSCVSGFKFGKFNSGFASDEEQQAEMKVSVDESLSCDKFKKGISHTELELEKELVTEDEFNQDDLGLQTTNFVDRDFELKGNSCDGQVQNTTADSEFLKDFGRKRKFKRKTTNKTIDSCIALTVESCGFNEADSELEKLKSNENSLEPEIGGVEVTSYELKRSKEHECSICFKVFPSGQALGGHKRAHYIGLTERRGKEIILMDQELPDGINDNLDLNIPVTLGEESTIDVGLKPWWAGYDRECEPLAIFN